MEKAQVHIYSGNGKGKTTASIGLCIRSYGAGFKVYFGQFCKKGEFSEKKVFDKLSDGIEIEQFGSGEFLNDNNFPNEKKLAQKGLIKVKEKIFSGEFNLVVLDELVFAVSSGLIKEEDVISIIKNRPDYTELVLTGRGAGDRLINEADLVTFMEEKKHYYLKGVKARKGIEY